MDEVKAKRAFDDALANSSQEFGSFFLSHLLGLEISYDDGKCFVEFEVFDFMFNPQGSMHGGLLSSVMDISMGHLLNKTCGAGITLEMKIQFVRPISSGRALVVGEFIKQGRDISFLRSEAFNENKKKIAFATSTWRLLRDS